MNRYLEPDWSTPTWLRAAGIGVAFFVLASATMIFTRFDGGLANIWLAGGLLLGELSAARGRHWIPTVIACAAANCVATILFGLGAKVALPLAVLNMGEAIIITLVLRRFKITGAYFESIEAVGVFVVATTVICLFTAIPGTALASLATGKDLLSQGRAWWAAHTLGMLVFAPVATLVLHGSISAWVMKLSRSRIIEALGLFVLVLATALLTFGQSVYPLLFLPMLPLLIATFRLERAGAAISVLIVALVGSLMTAANMGPVAAFNLSAADKSFCLQLYLAVTILTIMPVAAELCQRRLIFGRLLESEARFKLITESATDIIMTVDTRGSILYVSPSIREIGDYDADALVGCNAIDLVMPEDRAAVQRMHAQAMASPDCRFTVEYRALTKSGSTKWMESHCRSTFDNGRCLGAVSSIRDISHRKSLEIQLAHAAATDPLTGLANRRAFDLLLERKLADTRNGLPGGCIAVFDIDYFKRVNDDFGHAVGDLVLEQFAVTAREIVRATDHIARLGGEEFGIILDGADMIHAQRVCDRLRAAVADVVLLTATGDKVKVTVSAGIAQINADITQSALMRAADEALYRAKAAGRNRLALSA